MSDTKTIKLLGGPARNKIEVVPATDSSLIIFTLFNKDQLVLDFYNNESSDKVIGNIKEFKYVDSGIKDEKFCYFIPKDKQWFDYKKLREIYYNKVS